MRRGVAAARGRFDHPGKNDKGEAPRASTMAARKRNKGGNTGTAAAAARAAAASSGGGAKADQRARLDSKVKAELRGRHLAPLPLVLAVLVCSGVTWVLAFRDLMATGRPIMGAMDEAMLHFTKSTDFYDDSRGWKSKQGGLSSISPVTTDANNMGGLFVRKVGGAASLIVATQKIAPLVFQPNDAHWSSGHFRPVLVAGAVADLATVAFYASCSDDLAAAGAGGMSLLVCAVLAAEAIVLLGYAMAAAARRGPGSGGGRIPKGKTARSLPNRIVMKTVGIVTGLVSLISLRDLLIPGTIIGAIPRDDIYLEWTGALVHSPPPGSVEAEEHGMEAALHVGDRFASRLTALNVLLTCLFKVTSAFLVRVGKDGSGETKSRLIWRVQALGDGLITFVFRLFAMPASSASLDLRWHLMLLGYETFILFLYAYF